MRQRALCDEHSKMFEITEDTADRSFFSEIIASISDVKFAGENGRYIVSRDYLTVSLYVCVFRRLCFLFLVVCLFSLPFKFYL